MRSRRVSNKLLERERYRGLVMSETGNQGQLFTRIQMMRKPMIVGSFPQDSNRKVKHLLVIVKDVLRIG